jgi:hypothetical protein
MFSIIKNYNPDIITMDANEPNIFDGFDFRDWEFHHNHRLKSEIIDAKYFLYVFNKYNIYNNGLSYTIYRTKGHSINKY